MNDIAIVVVALIAAMWISELALRGTKLQTGLVRVLAAWGSVYALTLGYTLLRSGISPIGFTILWGGAFLSWFGLRSHAESSILLRMLVMLRRGASSDEELVARYVSLYGETARIDELCRGGLAQKARGSFTVTAKGSTVLRVVSKLR